MCGSKRIGIIDADLLAKGKHRFPNLACMKISGFHKNAGDTVDLLLNWEDIALYDKVFVSKVFTATPFPAEIMTAPNVEYGGTGFFFDKAPALPYEIEHCMPDYHLYDIWVDQQIQNDAKKAKSGRSANTNLRYYTDYSIGFTTRGCFRQCSFCVNRDKRKVRLASPISEFYDASRKAICLLDDQFLGYADCASILDDLQATGKPFIYKQGLDIRLMTGKLAEKFSKCKQDGQVLFAFDDITDSELIREKLSLWRKHTRKQTGVYVLCGYNEMGISGERFWVTDLEHCFRRVFLLGEYNCTPYIMRHEDYLKSPFAQIYTSLARWVNQPWALKSMTFRQFCVASGMGKLYKEYKHDPDGYLTAGHAKKSSWTAAERFLERYPHMGKWFDIKFGDEELPG